MWKIGFTGTSRGMTVPQYHTMTRLIYEIPDSVEIEAHHGNCVGADEEFHRILCDQFRERATQLRFVIHPGDNPLMQAGCEKKYPWIGTTVLPVMSNLARNAEIVMAVDEMFATPKMDQEELRSGTWHTIRTAKRLKRSLTIICRDGTVVKHLSDQPRQLDLVTP